VILLSRRLSAIEAPASQEARRDLEEIHVLTLSVADQLRRTSRNLRHAILDDLGLVAALRSEGDVTARQHSITVLFSVTGEPRKLPAATELMLLRVTQEALRNVVRHAAAENVQIRLSYRPALVKLSVADDGRGAGPPMATRDLLAAGKLGIVGMVERARLLGASCRIKAMRNRGTIVHVLVPGENPWRRHRTPAKS
jgi:signal transduction histidine kinase